MKKSAAIIAIIILSCQLMFAGDMYFVIQLKGGILNKNSGKTLKMGDKIDHEDQLKFLSSDAAAILLSTKRGRFVVKPTVKKGTENELTVFVKNVLLPVKSSGNLSTRGDEENGIIDLKSHLGTDKFVIIGDKVSMKLNTAKYPVDETHFFIYRYEYSGKPVAKRIPVEGDNLVFDKNLFYQTAGGSVSPDNVEFVDIYYFDAVTKNSTQIVKFSPLYLAESQVKDELKVQYEIFVSQKLPDTEIQKELTAYVNDIYGKTDELALKSIINSFAKN